VGLLLPTRRLADKFLYGALLPTYTFQRTKYQLPSWINLGVMEWPKIKKVRVADPQMPPSGHFLYRALVPVCTYQRAECQLSTSISLER